MMDLLRWMGWMFTRFVAVSVMLVSGWIFVGNLTGRRFEGWVQVWVLAAGLVGAVGGVAYLMSLDGVERFRTRRWRIGGWAAMLAAVTLPTSLTFMLVPLVLLVTPSLFVGFGPKEGVTAG
jgi:hypothetical protein